MDPHRNISSAAPSQSVSSSRAQAQADVVKTLREAAKKRKAKSRWRKLGKWGKNQIKKMLRLPYDGYFKVQMAVMRRNISRHFSPYRLLPSMLPAKNLYYAYAASNDRFPVLSRVSSDEFKCVKKEFIGPGGGGAFRVRWAEDDPAEVLSSVMAVDKPVDANVSKEVSISAPLNGKEAFEWKKRLVEMAEKRIVLSGNYCGGQPYDEMLELMEQQLEKKPDLNIVILLAPRMVLPANRENMDRIKERFPDRFQLVYCGEKWMNTSTNLHKKITNHTKGMVVDGKHCIMGGSGIEERWSYSDGVGEKIPKEKKKIVRNALSLVIAEEFRDIDFLFTGEKAGKDLDEELLKLARLWEHYNNASGTEEIDDSLVARMLAEKPEECNTVLPKEHLPNMTTTNNFKLYSHGPEMSRSAFSERLMSEIQDAKKHIYIEHQYVHPTQELSNLLAKKINEGVKVTVVTNGVESYSPNGHAVFGARNRYERAKIYRKINPANRHLLKWYEYGHGEMNTPRNSTMHAKVIVVDDTVLAGSSNLGFKSTVTCSDHEINLVSKSRALAEKTIESIEGDAFRTLRDVHIDDKPVVDEDGKVTQVPLSRESSQPGKITLRERFLARAHRKVAWLLG